MNYYRKNVNDTANDVKLKMQIGALTLKLSENNGNISSNLTKIGNNETNISSNLKLIGEKSDIIADNKNKITNNYNISQINKKKSEFNTSLIDNNKNNISSIKNDIENYYKLKHIIIFDTVNNINRAISKKSPKFSIFKNDIVYNFKKDSYIEYNLSILLFFVLHYINIQFFIYYYNVLMIKINCLKK